MHLSGVVQGLLARVGTTFDVHQVPIEERHEILADILVG